MPIPFGEPLDDRSRERYGRYMSRWSTRKVGVGLAAFTDANGVTWVDSTLSDTWMKPAIFNESIYQIRLTMLGGWVGNGLYRILIDGQKVYPFSTYDTVSSGTLVYLGTLSNSIRTGETCVVQFRSDNAADTGPAQTMKVELMLATHE